MHQRSPPAQEGNPEELRKVLISKCFQLPSLHITPIRRACPSDNHKLCRDLMLEKLLQWYSLLAIHLCLDSNCVIEQWPIWTILVDQRMLHKHVEQWLYAISLAEELDRYNEERAPPSRRPNKRKAPSHRYLFSIVRSESVSVCDITSVQVSLQYCFQTKKLGSRSFGFRIEPPTPAGCVLG